MNIDMPQHISVKYVKKLVILTLNESRSIFMLMVVCGKANTELATPLKYLVH